MFPILASRRILAPPSESCTAGSNVIETSARRHQFAPKLGHIRLHNREEENLQQLIEVSAAVVGGRVPLGLITVRQALNLPEIADFRFRRTSGEDGKTTVITRQDLQKLAQQ